MIIDYNHTATKIKEFAFSGAMSVTLLNIFLTVSVLALPARKNLVIVSFARGKIYISFSNILLFCFENNCVSYLTNLSFKFEMSPQAWRPRRPGTGRMRPPGSPPRLARPPQPALFPACLGTLSVTSVNSQNDGKIPTLALLCNEFQLKMTKNFSVNIVYY